MPRKTREEEFVVAVAQLGGLLILVAFLFPPARQVIPQLGGVAFAALSLIFVAFVVYRLVARARGAGQRPGQTPVTLQTAVGPPAAPAILQADQFIERLRAIDWFQFEKVIAAVYRRLGYSVARRGGANPDGGIDLIIEKDGERTAIQCKQWKTWNVGVRPVREFLGAMTDAGIGQGKLVTLCGYTGDAKRLADKHRIEIVNETELAKLLRATDAGYDPEIIAVLHDTRKVRPKCESEMVLRTAKKGSGAGSQFWGCSAYPRCRFTMPVS